MAILLGPPELDGQTKPPPSPETIATPAMALTENNSSGDPCLDLFFHVVPDTPSETLTSLLNSAWSHNALTTLKLICNLRGTGKSDKEGLYTPALLWLHRHHPKTLAENVSSLAEFGYFKDFPEILHRLLEAADVRKIAVEGRTKKFRRGKSTRKQKESAEKEPLKLKEKAKEKREQKRIEMAKKALDRLNLDPDLRFLHEKISDLFADRMKSDLESLNSGEESKISMSAKWCPSLDSSFDRSTLLCEAIARKIFPLESSPEYAEHDEAQYGYRVRNRLRKEVLVPLRRALELPEVYMSSNRWSELPYSRVPSVVMKSYKELFEEHDSERFKAYLASVEKGEAKIAIEDPLPHEVIRFLNDEGQGAVAELQWKRIVDDLAKNGKLKNCIAACDVSGNMCGVPMEVSVALGILVSQLSEKPWRGKVITFSEEPELRVIKGRNLREKVSCVKEMDCGTNTDFQKVFDKMLQVAMKAKLSPEQMVKRVFVLSDMEFDQASKNPWETDYKVIQRKYKKKEFPVPEIVFWNLRDSKAMLPVPGNQKGVALVSGFSKDLLSMFLGNDGVLSPLDVMNAAISGEDYEKLVVLD